MLRHDREKVVDVKMKDPRLYKEMECTLMLIYMCDYRITWKELYNNLIVPNEKVLSTMKDSDEFCILHHVSLKFSGYPRLEVFLILLLETFPSLIAWPNHFGDNSLAILCRFSDSESLILHVIELCPKSLEVLGKFGRYPLHFAVMNRHTSGTVIMKMIELFPQAIEARDEYGNYPLHYAIQKRRSKTVVLKMMELFPNAIQVPNDGGKHVLHLAVQCKQSEVVVLKMLDLYPQVIEKMDDRTIDLILCHVEKHYSKTSKKCTTSTAESPVLEKLNQLISNKKKRKYEFLNVEAAIHHHLHDEEAWNEQCGNNQNSQTNIC